MRVDDGEDGEPVGASGGESVKQLLPNVASPSSPYNPDLVLDIGRVMG